MYEFKIKGKDAQYRAIAQAIRTSQFIQTQLLPTIRVRTALAVGILLRSLYQLEPMCIRIVDL
jgi:hypothetical protein